MSPSKTGTLEVPGANLYYEIRGSGPVLLLICGGVYDAAGYAGLAQQLADRYTVVTYDRRGNSRSPLDGPPEHQSIEVHGDDAHRVLSAVGVTGSEPARVFGNSSGAMIGLELAARHPGQVRTVVAHEPPIFELLPDRDHWRAVMRDVEDTFGAKGAGPAGEILNAALRMSGGGEEDDRAPGGGPAPQGEPDPETMQMMARMGQNLVFFIGYEVPTFSRHMLDLAPLSTVDVRLAVGAESQPSRPYVRAARAIAEQIGAPIVTVPGAHGGFGTHASAFATVLGSTMDA